MTQTISPYGPREWSEARRRAETYLRALQGGFGQGERALLAQALAKAHGQNREDRATHPVTLVMESLFGLLPPEDVSAPVAMTPPMQRVTMLPEKTEFPFHDGMRRLFQVLPFADAR